MSRKILFLHGYAQNSTIFKSKTGVLRKALGNIGFECFFPNGLLVVQTDNNLPIDKTFGEDSLRCWWKASDDRLVYDGLDDTLSYLEKLSIENGPFDGIFGFSQGATLAALFASYTAAPPQWIICVGGFFPRSEEIRNRIVYCKQSLHVMGRNDDLVPMANSLELQNSMNGKSDTFTHDGGHMIPLNSSGRSFLLDWIVSANLIV